MEEYIVPSKYMYACKDNKQFITSYGNEFTKRKKGGMVFDAVDGVWVRPFLPDLKYGENSVEVDLTVTLKRRPHSHRMWLFGAKKHRRLVEWKPKFENNEWYVRGGAVYLAVWCDKEFFDDLDDQQPIEVYVTAKRV